MKSVADNLAGKENKAEVHADTLNRMMGGQAGEKITEIPNTICAAKTVEVVTAIQFDNGDLPPLS